MKTVRNRFVAGWLVLLLCVASLCATAFSAAAEDMPQFDWMGYTLGVEFIRQDPDHIVGNPAPDSDSYVLMRFRGVGGEVSIGDIVEYVSYFYLEDGQGEEYYAVAYMPYSIAYNERNQAFTTSPMQSAFDMLFIVPTDVDLTTLTLVFYYDDEEILFSIGDPAIAALLQ